MLWSIDSCQNRVCADQYHMTVFQSWAHVSQVPLRIHTFLKNFADKFPVFNWLQAQLQLDFFVIVTSLLFEVNYKPGDLLLALAKSILCYIRASFWLHSILHVEQNIIYVELQSVASKRWYNQEGKEMVYC